MAPAQQKRWAAKKAKNQPEVRNMRRRAKRLYFFGPAVSSLSLSQTGLANSVLQIGHSSHAGPSDFTKAGATPPKTETLVSGGCFPPAAPKLP